MIVKFYIDFEKNNQHFVKLTKFNFVKMFKINLLNKIGGHDMGRTEGGRGMTENRKKQYITFQLFYSNFFLLYEMKYFLNISSFPVNILVLLTIILKPFFF